MPSPFPGMDPYPEDPAVWPGFHSRFIASCSELLTQELRPRYFAEIEQRVYIVPEGDPARHLIVPDIMVQPPRHRKRKIRPGHTYQRDQEAVGVLDVAEPIVMQTIFDGETRETRIEIRDIKSRTVVCVIELISPTNKVNGSVGQQCYREKRAEIFSSPAHFIEIDLLRSGQRNVNLDPALKADYSVHLSRAERRPSGTIWPIRLQQPLPEIPIPLKAGDADGSLDLQQVLSLTYDRGGYDLILDYRDPPVPALSPETDRWRRQLLKPKRKRRS